MNTAVHIPPEEQAELAALKANVRAEVVRWLDVVDTIEDFDGGRVAAFKFVENQHGTPHKTVERMYYKFAKARDWRVFVNKSKQKCAGRGGAGLPRLFVDYWKGLVSEHQRDRTVATAHEALRRRLEAWENGDASKAIPGYPSPPARRRGCMPRGMSYKNLSRECYLPTKAELSATRSGGRQLAAVHLPSNISTRVGLKHRQRVYFDDRWSDLKVYSDGNKVAQRPIGFLCVDHLTAARADWCWGLQAWDLVEEKRKSLTNIEFAWFALKCLSYTVGFRRDGSTVYVGEGGTASFGPIADALRIACGNRINFEISGSFGDPVITDMFFGGKRGGNPRFKAPVESTIGLSHNRYSSLIGQVGLDPAHQPEELHGMDRYATALWKIAQEHPEIGSLLDLPFLTMDEFLPVADTIERELNQRDNHNLEGFRKCGFVKRLMRAARSSDNWIERDDVLKLPAPRREEFAVAAGDPECIDVRVMTPQEAFDTCPRPEIEFLDPMMWPTVLPREPEAGFAVPVTVRKKNVIGFTDRRSGEPVEYWAEVRHPATGDNIRLGAGRELLVFANPLCPDQKAPCTTPEGVFVGMLDPRLRPCAADRDGRLREQGRINQTRAEILRDVEFRTRHLRDRRKLGIEHNAAVIAAATGQKKQKRAAKRRRERSNATLEAIEKNS